MKNIITRYNVHLSLGAGGSRVAQFKTLDEAKAYKGKKRDLTIWKTYYQKIGDKWYQVKATQC